VPANAAEKIRAEGDLPLATTANRVSVVKILHGQSVAAKVAAYSRRNDVVYAEPNYVAQVSLPAPNDPSYGLQWGLAAIHAPAGWNAYPGSFVSTGGSTIAIIDTGIDSLHPDLAAKVLTGSGAICLTGSCVANPALDNQGHGSHVAGIAAGMTNNSTGIAGVAISSPLLPVKAMDSTGSGTYASITSGILWAASHGARVLNLSLGGYAASQTLCDAVATVIANGAVVIAAAGNNGTTDPSYPAACPGAIGVAATDSNNESPYWSNFGSPNVFLSAPGDAIYSTYWQNGSTYATLTGTSMATPHVAGLAALLLSQVPTRTPAMIRTILAQTADKVGADFYPGVSYGPDPYGTCTGCSWHPFYGYGLINVQRALESGAPSPSISGFSPGSGGVGSSVTISGANLSGATGVSLCFVPTSSSVVSPGSVSAVVPAGACDGRWRVTTPGGTAVSDGAFVVTSTSPSISGFSPGSGGVGSTVTIAGTNFTGATDVSLCFVPTSFTVVTATSVTASVPVGACDGRWRVTTPGGTAVSDGVFTNTSPTISGFSPGNGAVGSTVTIAGTHFTGATAVSLCLVPALFTVFSDGSISATVPPGACDGRWRVTTASGTAVSDGAFTNTSPTISVFSPGSGAVGSTVTITGTNLTDATEVSLCFVPTPFTVVTAASVTAIVPGGACDGRWRVTTPSGTGASGGAFSVT
jgi:thermitase